MRQLAFILPFLLAIFFSCNKKDNPDYTYVSHDYLSLEDAKAEISSLLNDINPIITRSGQPERRIIQSTWTKTVLPETKATARSSSKLYVINFEDSLGFAIVSSDPHKNVLGLALSGSLSENDTIDNPGLAITLANLEAYAKIPTRVDSIDHCEYGPWTNTTFYAPTNGYCPVKWSGGTPTGNQFNAYCPIINGIHCPAGCVAVAVAQLMSIYRYPTYYDNRTLDWTAMIQDSSAQDNQGDYYVGRLLQHLGFPQYLNVIYTPYASGAITPNIPHTMYYFGYENGASYHNFAYSDIQEMKNHYPVIIDGEPASGNGHAWLGHGVLVQTREIRWCSESGEIMMLDYEDRELVLCNFCWGGAGDGFYSPGAYYTTSGPEVNDPNLSTGSTGLGNYPYNVHCVSGIRVP